MVKKLRYCDFDTRQGEEPRLSKRGFICLQQRRSSHRGNYPFCFSWSFTFSNFFPFQIQTTFATCTWLINRY